MSGRRRLEKEVVLNATPEQVWEMVTTAPGFSAWFVPHGVDEDGQIYADFGGPKQSGRVLAWEPGKRVVYGGPESVSVEQNDFALEFLVEGRAQGGTVLRLVQSGFFDGESWEDEYDGFSRGWNIYLHNLVQYFDHFAGLPVVNVLVVGATELDRAAVWQRFDQELGVTAETAVGERVNLTPTGIGDITGVVDLRGPGVLGVRTGSGLYRFTGEGADVHAMISVCHYLYGGEADQAEQTARWRSWLDRLFPAA